MNPARPSRGAAEGRYRATRLAALRRAEEIVADRFAPTPVRLDLINRTSLQAFQVQWEEHPRRRYQWPWATMAEDYQRKAPDRFEVSVWSGHTLCGLALGETRRTFCRVDWLEASPEPAHPLKGNVAIIVSGAAVVYATAINRGEIRLMNPLPDVVPLYQALGFAVVTPAGSDPYCSWQVP